MAEKILVINNVSKSFPGVKALDNINFELNKGEIHALIGENGAGKSTLMKILTGVNKPDQGEISYLGQKYQEFGISQAKKLGISMIYQELYLVPYLSVAENIFFGKEPKKHGFVDYKTMHEKSKIILEKLGVNIDTNKKIKELTIAYQQIVEIAKAISDDAKILIMDEPTAPLSNEEINMLFKLIKRLQTEGVSIIYISHRLEEIFKICDRVTVFRDGKYITTEESINLTKEKLIKLMVGRSISNQYPESANTKSDETVLEIENLENEKLSNVSFTLKKGEILGVGGLVGSGRTEILRAIYGADSCKGKIRKNNKLIKNNHPTDAIRNGIALIPEDRKGQGLLLKLSVNENIVFSVLKRMKKFGMLNKKIMKNNSVEYIKKLNIKTPDENKIVRFLSGGNQQKVIIAKWLLTKADVFLIDEPTRGIDVGAKYEIYSLMNNLKEQGKSIIMVSSEMPELIGMSDRIIVMCDGRVSGCIEQKGDFDKIQECIMDHACNFANH